MEEAYIGKAVSIHCDEKLGVFQGTIKDISSAQITIVRAFRNGVPLRKQDAEVTLNAGDIKSLELIPSISGHTPGPSNFINKPTPMKQQHQPSNGTICKESTSTLTSRMSSMKIACTNGDRGYSPKELEKTPPKTSNVGPAVPLSTSNVAAFFKNMIPPKVEVKLGASLTNYQDPAIHASSRPIDIMMGQHLPMPQLNNLQIPYQNGNGVTVIENGQRMTNDIGMVQRSHLKKLRPEKYKHNNNTQTFGTPVDDPIMSVDFDFEGNLAKFDKQAIWDDIESEQRPRNGKKLNQKKKKKVYRHDENILTGENQLKQIETIFQPTSQFVTDNGLIIPTIPLFVRSKIQQLAAKNGLIIDRQNEILARGTTDLALLILGGARRLIPNNSHQWPTIVVICDNENSGEIGAATGRQLASHGLKVVLYTEDDEINSMNNMEIQLFKATKNIVVNSVLDLPTPDLVIISVNTSNLSSSIIKWLTDNRSSTLAIDPPPNGFENVQIKCSILPLLPLNNISQNCGQLHLCNIGIPDQYYRDAGIVYNSPFGHKFVIQIHSKD